MLIINNNKKGFTVFIVISIIAVLAICGVLLIYKNKNITQYIGSKLGECEVEESRSNTISPDVAKAVALNQVINYNKPYDWVFVGYYPIYGSSGLVNYYAFIFRKSEFTKFTTLNSLEQNSSNYSDKSDNDNKYQFNDIASIWTSASDGQELIMRDYRGIPEIIAEKIKIKKFIEDKYGDKTIGNIIADSVAGKMYFDIINKSNEKETGDVVSSDYSISSKNKLIKSQNELNDRKAKRNARYDQKQCDMLKQAMTEREAYLRNRWGKYNQ